MHQAASSQPALWQASGAMIKDIVARLSVQAMLDQIFAHRFVAKVALHIQKADLVSWGAGAPSSQLAVNLVAGFQSCGTRARSRSCQSIPRLTGSLL